MGIITNARGVRTAWGDMLDGLLLSVHGLGGGEQLSLADRTILTVRALRFWPDTTVTTMVDRVLTVEDTIAARPGALAMLADRNADTLLVDSLLRPVIFASTVRTYGPAEVARLVEGVAAAGVAPAVFGLPV